jgi:hypothetical protein
MAEYSVYPFTCSSAVMHIESVHVREAFLPTESDMIRRRESVRAYGGVEKQDLCEEEMFRKDGLEVKGYYYCTWKVVVMELHLHATGTISLGLNLNVST